MTLVDDIVDYGIRVNNDIHKLLKQNEELSKELKFAKAEIETLKKGKEETQD